MQVGTGAYSFLGLHDLQVELHTEEHGRLMYQYETAQRREAAQVVGGGATKSDAGHP